MPKFFVVHPMGKEMTPEEAAPIARAVKGNLNPDAYWIKSWYAREEGKLYCEWDAKDRDAIKLVCDKTPELPVEGIYELDMIMSSESFR